ncbi:hypothetical protein Snoj_46040 [Streptomyces nojiriensis]|uniref:Uncharacterized protein n=1 Tax=Streptomyces nojiriensis TaxID=66374 RepID=A0ABQ3SRB6_9ACTN|nr:hypothetical protein [Streptomyces nojiriensis]QTI44243.1 hypothetical protein JYK04_02010 [Streptomyces nojiriensis]GGS37274.1 hypothetical protein GCM10010205_79110 [Streptomyces nojiriensis]GHI70686.1 hypothetical protein Snoj_46040 [Streptomyces nojiriensis]
MPRKNDTGARTGAHRTRTADRRRLLRREVPGTIGLLADPGDFAAMRGYRSFTFDDHQDYLHHVDGLLRSLAAQGIHTTVALFDPEEYAEFCGETGLDPDTAETRARFTAELAGTGALLPYSGQPIDELVPLLVDEAVRQATWEYATGLLAEVGHCADCGEDIGHSSFDRAADALKRLVAGAGPGHHHFVCSIPTEAQQLVAVLHADTTDDPAAPPRIESREGLDFVTVLAAGLALGGPGGLVVRTTDEGRRDRVHGWRLDRGRLTALSAAAVFNAYCTDADTGDPVAPESGVEYCPGYEVDAPGPHH